jgi:hypothetical protein
VQLLISSAERGFRNQSRERGMNAYYAHTPTHANISRSLRSNPLSMLTRQWSPSYGIMTAHCQSLYVPTILSCMTLHFLPFFLFLRSRSLLLVFVYSWFLCREWSDKGANIMSVVGCTAQCVSPCSLSLSVCE